MGHIFVLVTQRLSNIMQLSGMLFVFYVYLVNYVKIDIISIWHISSIILVIKEWYNLIYIKC